MSKLLKSIKRAKHILKGQTQVAPNLAKAENDLFKGVHDAMYHHAMHAKAAHNASFGDAGKPYDSKKSEACKEKAKKHEYFFARHALEHAHKKARYPGDLRFKLQKAMDFYDSESYCDDKDHDYKKAKDHFSKGGDFVAHKDDSLLKE